MADREAKGRAAWAKEHPLIPYPKKIMIGIVQPVGGIGGAASKLTKAEQLAVNAEKGVAWENKVGATLRETDPTTAQQVTLETQSGVRTRMDFVSQDANGNIVLTEAKSSPTAPLTPNQAAAHPEIANTGATVVGQGKPGYPGGTQIPPTPVNVPRPQQ